jgi:phosphatidate cytidylyltransferase
VWVALVAKFTDMGGYLVGRAVGRHKLAPTISPGKTWEGVAGGLVFAAGVAALAARYGAPAHFLPDWLRPGLAALLALPIAAASILSDLAESALKRRAGVKDSGRCIPGIGGALDLVDSLLLPAVTAYYLFGFAAR